MKKFTFFTILFVFILGSASAQLSGYKKIGQNLITNSNFSSGTTNWDTPHPGDNTWHGWRWDNTFTYGSTLWMDNELQEPITATSNTMNFCQGYPKQINFSFTSSNTGPYTLKVRLGGQLLGTFTKHALYAQSIFTPASTDDKSILYNYWSSHYVTDGMINNNIWHEFSIIVSNYQGTASGALTFEYTRASGVSRMVYLDNVEVYEVIPTPIPTQTEVYLPDCDADTKFNLNTLLPSDTRYTYKWFNSANTSSTYAVSDPTKAGAGTYYLFASATCTGTTNYSHPSAAVIVRPAMGCCETNVVKDGTFSLTEPGGDNPNYLVPLGDSDGNGTHWKRNFDNADDEFHIVDGNVTFGTKTLEQPLKMSHAPYKWMKLIYQNDPKISRWGKKIIEFDFVMGSAYNASHFTIYLKPNVPNNTIHQNFIGIKSFSDYPLIILYKFGSGGRRWRFTSGDGLYPGCNAYVDGQTAVIGSTIYDVDRVYRIRIEVPANLDNSSTDHFGGIAFWGSNVTDKYIDNVSVTVMNPDNPVLNNKTATVNCATGFADLTSLSNWANITSNKDYANRNLVGLQFHWFTTNSSTGTRVPDPTKVAPGKYYLFAFNPDTECYSDGYEEVTVTQNCPVIHGAVYNDWDGATGGVANQSTVQNSVLYVHLVNPGNNQVIKSTQLKADGTYTMTAAANTQYLVVLSDRNAEPGATAPAYPPGVKPTGEAVNDVPDGTADGKATYHRR